MKKITGIVKLQLPAGKATPAPPVGPDLGTPSSDVFVDREQDVEPHRQVEGAAPLRLELHWRAQHAEPELLKRDNRDGSLNRHLRPSQTTLFDSDQNRGVKQDAHGSR